MPTTVQALLAFAVFIVPGFLLRTGYTRTRAKGSIEADLYALAEAVVGSLFLLAIAWWWKGADVFHWLREGSLSDPNHERSTYYFLLALLLVPYPLGLALGWMASAGLNYLAALRRKHVGLKAQKVFQLIDQSGIFHPPTVWDQLWNQLGGTDSAYLARVRMRSGVEIVATFRQALGLASRPNRMSSTWLACIVSGETGSGIRSRTRKGCSSMAQQSTTSSSSPPAGAARGKLAGVGHVPSGVTLPQSQPQIQPTSNNSASSPKE